MTPKLRLAIVGAGPAGIYAADILLKADKQFAVSIDLFEQLNESGITLIIVTHEPDIARRARRRLTFRDGQIVEDAA